MSRVKAKDIQRKGKSIYEEKGIYACRSGTAYEYVIDCFNRLWKVR